MTDARRRALLAGLLLFVPLLAGVDGPEGGTAQEQAQRLVESATAIQAQGRLSEAVRLLETALNLVPDYVPAHQLAAVVYQRLRDPARAMDHFWAVQRASFPPLPDTASEPETKERELLVQCEALLAYLSNEERLSRGLRLFLPDPCLAVIARQHSEEMRDLKYFSHESPTPGYRTIADRFLRVFPNLPSWAVAENIASRYHSSLYSLSSEAVQMTHTEWMNSPSHRSNILKSDLTHIGVGLAVNSRGDYWATQFFARYGAGGE